MALPLLKTLVPFGLVVACGIAGTGAWMLFGQSKEAGHAQNPPDSGHSEEHSAPDDHATANAPAPPAASHGAQADPGPMEPAAPEPDLAHDAGHDGAEDHGSHEPAAHGAPSADARSEEHAAAEQSPAPHPPADTAADTVVAGAEDHEDTSHTPLPPGERSEDHETAAPAKVPGDRPASKRDLAELIRADSLLRKGDVAAAMKIYRDKIRGTGPTTDPVVHFHCALCAETLGFLDDAAEGYQDLARHASSAEWRGFALWGVARVLQQQKRTDLAIRIGYELLLTQTDNAPLWKDDLAHWLGHLLYRRATEARSTDLLADDTLAGCQITVRMAELRNLASLLHAQDLEGAAAQQPADVIASDAVKLKFGQLTVLQAVQKIASAAGWTVEWHPRAESLASHRVCHASTTAAPRLLIDAICEPIGLQWQLHGTTLHIDEPLSAEDERRLEFQRDAATRCLEQAVGLYPEHRWTAQSRLGRAQLAAERGETEAAIRDLMELTAPESKSPIVGEAWFDLGKLHRREGRSLDAIRDFERSGDHCGGTSLEPYSQMLLAREWIEAGEPRKAIVPLRRAIALAAKGDRPRAILMLAAANLLLNRPESANEVLRSGMQDVNQVATRDAAAFLSAFSQVLGARDAYRRKYDQRALTDAVSHVTPQSFFGAEGALLIAQAYANLGLTGEAADVCRHSIASMRDTPLRRELQVILVDEILVRGDRAEAEAALLPLVDPKQDRLRPLVYERLCRVMLAEGRLDEVQVRSAEWVSAANTAEEQLQALRVLGTCLERKGDRLNAALCFAGSRPNLDPKSSPAQSAANNPPSVEGHSH